MSQFDKEAEREKLRKKLEQDQDRRETTEQMSELLLKGATMLNAHCAECASPIFRYEDDEFCPTCGRSVEELQTAEAEEAPSEADVAPGNAATGPEASPRVEAASDGTGVAQTPNRAPEQSRTSVPETTAGEALDAAIARLADRAATADDPRQATELLDAAHRAAETLAIVERRRPDA